MNLTLAFATARYKTARAALLCVATLFAATAVFAQPRANSNAPQALEVAPATSSLEQGAAPAEGNGLRIAPGSKARPPQAPAGQQGTGTGQPAASTGQPSAAQTPATPDPEAIARALTNTEPLQPPRDIIRTGYWQQNGHWLLPLLVLIALLLAATGYSLYRRSRRPVVLSPQLLALQSIQNAEAQKDDKRFAIDVSNAVRSYLEARFKLRAPEQTTEEFLQEARTASHLPQPSVDALAQLLQLCDLAKFARQGLTAAQRTQLSETALQLVNSLGEPQENQPQNGGKPQDGGSQTQPPPAQQPPADKQALADQPRPASQQTGSGRT